MILSYRTIAFYQRRIHKEFSWGGGGGEIFIEENFCRVKEFFCHIEDIFVVSNKFFVELKKFPEFLLKGAIAPWPPPYVRHC